MSFARMRFVAIVALACIVGVTSTAAAQDTEQVLRAQIAVERQRITELEAELARRDAALGTLAARLDELERAKASPARFDFYADSLVRLATLHQGECDGCPNRTIGRFRLRFGAEGRLAPGLRAVFGLSAGELNDPNSVYQTLGGNLARKVATWDRAYMSFRPAQAPGLDLTAGKFPYTWLRSSMTFDVDFYPEGLSERFARDIAHAGFLKNASVQGMQIIVNEQPSGPDTMLIGGQAIAGLRLSDRVTTRVVLTGIDVRRPEFVLRAQLNGSDVGVRNTNAILPDSGPALYASRFRYANAIVESAIKTRWESLPVTATVEYQRNVRAVSGHDIGTSFRLDAGRQQRPGDWGLSWHFFRVEQDAIVSGLGESDWRAPSNVIQHRFAVTRTVQDHVQVLFTWYRGRTLDRTLPGAVLIPELREGIQEPWANRMYFDLLYRF